MNKMFSIKESTTAESERLISGDMRRGDRCCDLVAVIAFRGDDIN